MTAIRITRTGPLCTIQDAGRFGMLRHGISASGPMDRAAFERAAAWIGGAGAAGIEFTMAGIGFVVEGGSVVHAEFIRQGLWQKMIVFVAPMIVGGGDAPSIFSGEAVSRLTDAYRFRFDRVDLVGSDMMVTAYAD